LVAGEGASAVAYVVISAHRNEWTIDSCGDRDPDGARLGAILQVLIAREPAEVRPTISGWLPANLRPIQVIVERDYEVTDVMMVRPLTGRGEAMRTLRGDDVFYWKGDLF
jgi:hypothetical protein